MNTPPYIINTPLPETQDFAVLKEQGLDFIMKHGADNWNNLNASDPGVTILDQVCYALSELGYCSDFPLADLLTNADGKMDTSDQFYAPADIFTTTPVTANDYRKLMVDQLEGVVNALITALPQPGVQLYQPFLLAGTPLTADAEAALCQAALIVLQANRNLGQFFLMPQLLQPLPLQLSGTLTATGSGAVETFMNNVQQLFNNYIFPPVSQSGTEALLAAGYTTDDMLNGPQLKNGWITDAALGDKKDSLQLTELNQFLLSLKDITAVAVSGINVPGVNGPQTTVTAAAGQLLTLDLPGSIQSGTLVLTYNGVVITAPLATASPFTVNTPPTAALGYPASSNTAGAAMEAPPAGQYRDVSTYYAIQNTFPEVYAVGADAVTSNASAYQTALSRQLKGYLTLFDQVLANEFAQVAGIGQLFSFRNAVTGAPTDNDSYYAVQDAFQKKHPQYPVPYKTFSPTYFYQSLYDVPHIRPLLKGYQQFDFNIGPLPPAELEEKSWAAYRQNPYNPYIYGLMECVEDEAVNLERRNAMLDHLLARYGEAPLLTDAIVEGSVCCGDPARDRIIFKSLWLQNLGLLTYYRVKGANTMAITPLLTGLPDLPEHFEPDATNPTTVDFVVNMAWIDAQEKIPETSFVNFSAAELKCGLLLGLETQYRNYIANNYKNAGLGLEVQTALWMMEQRRGLMLIETGLLEYACNYGKGAIPGTSQAAAYGNQIIVVMPGFIPQFATAAFQQRLQLLLTSTLPVTLPVSACFTDAGTLANIIAAFSAWMNSCSYLQDPETNGCGDAAAANALYQLLIPITTGHA